ncbi:MAG: hypothetical protein B7Y12_00570 [Rhizobiales bacterium 24-66-13]|nr:MAG: hypothetical protein B7Z41_01240 [Rhizobiales bacterium 12-66-7]OYY14007.1 MAG: hypothetical protein B7Y70_00055 [Rhizobiales bacterium 35-68-8]OYZ83098.1 MAG: hypothetical protein B7Y12_00570 [Rhizobiales bacterium 24-66-13]
MLPSTSSVALEELGWSSFQDLALAYAEDFFDIPFVSFAKGKDGGSDGEQTIFTQAEQPSSRVLVQAKHTSTLRALTVADFEPDLTKMAALIQEGFRSYILITNLSLTRNTEVQLRGRALEAGFERFEIHGRDQIIRRIRSSPRLRALAPRLYGVGDLSQILDERRIEQAKALIAAAKGDIDRFVATDAYRASVRALETTGIVFLLGAPAAGKSTIARALSVAALDAFGAAPFMLESLTQITAHWNPLDPTRLFWIDDAFGSTQVDPAAADAFNRVGPVLSACLAEGNRIVLTSRTHIWKSVRDGLKRSTTAGFDRGIVEIKVEQYTPRDRAQIVYNHVKLGDQTPEWRAKFKPLAHRVAEHEMFTPEVARRFGLSTFTSQLEPTVHAIDAFIRNPASYLEEVIGGLTAGGRAGLALIQISGGSAPVSDTRSSPMALVCSAYETSPGQVLRELEALEGSLCVRVVKDGEPQWRYRHPTIGEAVASITASSPALLDVYLAGTNVGRILDEAVCAGLSVEGAIIQIGISRYDALIARIQAAGWTLDSRHIRWFLIVKATPEFRRRYFTSPITKGHPLVGRYGLDHQLLILLALLRNEGLIDSDYLRDIQHRILRGIQEHGIPSCLSRAAQEIVGSEDFSEAIASAMSSLQEGGASFMRYWEPSKEELDQMASSEAFGPLKEFLEMLDGNGDEEEYAAANEVMQEAIATRISEIEAEIEQENWYHQEEEHDCRSRNTSSSRVSARSTATADSAVAALFRNHSTSSASDIFSDIDE